ncbi:winged helix-turn-helix transcriptional regulator [Streptomyces sulphureus]|uniref:winged helix-turn-helix transcriptional regulator n=1 Tax=Streptomyces sulphureus TaxID=47758 RepID=UPI00037B288D|nr:helix-turn-helix domain-containing protein [Streptomyces sulphureus]
MPSRTRRSYDQFCAIARALDSVGDRWTLLIVRELLAGPRRYTDLHADLPGVSTDILAARLRHMEQAELVGRRRLASPASAFVYELTERGAALLPVLRALAEWGAPLLDGLRPTDAVRAHWFAVPLQGAVARALRESAGVGEPPDGAARGVLDVHLEEGSFHLHLDVERLCGVRPGAEAPPLYEPGRAESPDVVMELDARAPVELANSSLTLREAISKGAVRVHGESWLAEELRRPAPEDRTAEPDGTGSGDPPNEAAEAAC